MQPAKPTEPAILEGRRQTLLAVWKEAREHSRQHEAQRSVATNMVLLLASADIGAIATLRFELRTLPLALALVILGAFGYVLSAKHYERGEWSTAVAVEIERRLDELDPDAGIRLAKVAATTGHERRYPRMHRIRLNKMWSLLHLVVAATGVAFTIIVWTTAV
jgi:hypothetical protein